MQFTFFRKYLIFSGLICNLALVYGVYTIVSQLSQYGTLPTLLNKLSHKISDVPPLKSTSSTLSNIAQSLDKASYQWKPFKREHWPTLGPDFSIQTTSTDKIASSIVYVSSSKDLLNAIKNAQPGNTIIVADGEYRLQGKRFMISQVVATQHSPIILRAENPGQAKLLLGTVEGLFLPKPYWTITGFIFQCSNSNCEHAMHIVGDAHHTTIKNNEFIDFNASLKVNGYKANGQYPDHGVVKNNYFHFTKPRSTRSSVTPINIDHANGWVVSHNIIRDFIKIGGNKISYGAFIKGGASDGVFENNLIVCNTTPKTYLGSQLGLSIGGGGMNERRDNALYEAKNSIIRNNIISHCNDAGIYINNGLNSLINNNTIYNTLGIDIRFSESSAVVVNNFFSGMLRERDNGKLIANEGNIIYDRSFLHNYDKLNDVFLAPEIGNFTIRDNGVDIYKTAIPYPIESSSQTTDFCGQPITSKEAYVGAFKDEKGCFVAN